MKTTEPTAPFLFRLISASAAALVISLGAAQTASAQGANYPATILSNKPVAFYQLQELPGAIGAVDSSPNGLDANYVFDPSGVSPALGFPGIDTNSIAFLGNLADGYGLIDIPYNLLLAPVAEDGSNGAPFSIECWAEAYTANVGTGIYFSILGMFGPYASGAYGNASGWLLGQTPGTQGSPSQWLFNMKNGGFLDVGNVVPMQWTHLVGTFDGTNQYFYIDGSLAFSQNIGTTSYLPDDGSDGAIGGVANAGFPPYAPWLGGVDEVAFYTNALTALQVSNDYVVGLNPFNSRPVAPAILVQPESATNYSGTDVSFSVVAAGSLPLYYHWSRLGVGEIPGATNAIYTFESHYPDDDGAIYSVAISNSLGALGSDPATNSVETNILVEGPPFSITRNVGSHAAFRAAVVGALPITYQWSVSTNGGASFANLPNQTGDTLWLTNVQMTANSNQYAVVVSSPFMTYSNAATLTVQPRAVNVPLTGYAAIVAADQPVAFWLLDESSNSVATTNGVTATDAVGSFDGFYDPTNGNIVWGIPTGIPNDTNTGVDLQDPQTTVSGLGASVQIPYALELNPFGPWSVEAWVRPDSVDDQERTPISSIFNTNYDNNPSGWDLFENASIPTFWGVTLFTAGTYWYTGTDAAYPISAPGTWNHLVLTDDGTSILLYVNGQVGNATTVAASGYTPQGLNGDETVAGTNEVIGQRSDLESFGANAGMADVAIYNYALTPTQIQAHYLGRPTLVYTQANRQIVLTWPLGLLMGTTNLMQPFQPVVGATSPYPVPLDSGQFFYEVVVH
jgi:hypothetical protein